MLDPEPRSASATAASDTLLLKLEEDDAYELMEERTEVLKSIMIYRATTRKRG
jgi:CRP-like cAMP-binding protein